MNGTINIETGKDHLGEFIQHNLKLNGTATHITRHYYKVVDEALIANMPQDILDNMVEQGKLELEARVIKKHPNFRMSDSQHLRFIFKRLVHLYDENTNYDYMIRFAKIIEQVEEAEIDDLFGDGSQFKDR